MCDCKASVWDCSDPRDCGTGYILDACNVCNGPGIPDGECDCAHNVLDCNFVCGGNAVLDECDVCNGPGLG